MGDETPSQGYSIRVASRLTGVSSDTLRMWERRYGFPKPARNSSQVRVYTDEDIERLILIARSLKCGFRAGEVIHRSPQELRSVLSSSSQAQLGALRESPTIETLLNALRADDPEALRTGLRQAVATLGSRQFLMEVAGPLVEQVGEAWAAGSLNVRHEHLLSEALSTQIRLLLSAYEAEGRGPTILLTTLSHEQHGLGLEMAALYLSQQAAIPRLLGVDTPPDQIVEAAQALQARVVGLSVSSSSDPTRTLEHVHWIVSELPDPVEVWLGGRAAGYLDVAAPRIHRVITWSDVDRELSRLRSVDSAAQ